LRPGRERLAIALLLLAAARGHHAQSILNHPYVTVAGRDLLVDVHVPPAGRRPATAALHAAC
jgi:hypothetical protein